MAVTDIPLGDATNPDIVWLLKPDLVTKTPLVATAGGAIPVSMASAATPPTGASATQVQGTAADNAVAVGSPVLTAVIAKSVPDTYTAGDVAVPYATINGILGVGLVSSAGTMATVATTAGADGSTNTTPVLRVAAYANYLNPSNTWDRARGDVSAGFVKAPPLGGTDRSITATTTSQQLMAANTTRSKFYIKNDTLIDVWINFGATAVAAAGTGNMKIAAGAYYEFTGSNGAINIIASSTTAAVTCREF